MSGIYLLLGSNMGERLGHLQEACRLLTKEGVRVLRVSSIYETAPWGKTDQQWFLNVAIEVSTSYASDQLLNICLGVESIMGRVREEKWGERLIDIDILYYQAETKANPDLEIPHPGIPGRRFTLMPMAELAADFPHPLLGKTQQQLLDAVEDPLEVFRTNHMIVL